MSPEEHHKFTHYAPYAVMVMIALVGGVFFTVLSAQQNQDIRSKAAITTSTVSINPTDDARVSSKSTGTNYGSAADLRAENDSSDGGVHYSYLKFNLAPFAGEVPTSIKLRIKTTTHSDSASPGTFIHVKFVSSTSWTESGITYSNKPSISSTTLGSFIPKSTNTSYDVSISPIYLQQYMGKTITLAISTTDVNAAFFNSRQASSGKPELIVTYPSGSPTTYPTPTKAYVPTPTPTVYNAPTPTPTVYNAPTPTPTPTVYDAPTPTAAQYPTSTPMPEPTVQPGSTTISLLLALHGLGKGGDNANPNGTGNFNPIHPQRAVHIEVYNASNNLVQSASGIVSLDSSSGLFDGVVSLGTALNSGSYTIKVRTDQFLRTLVPGIQTLTSGQKLDLPKTSLVGGDINSDNTLNILDYNILMGCYSDLAPATNCASGDEVSADITDDGAVNQFDYNLFLRELSNRGGN